MTLGQTPEEQLAARIGQGGVDAAKALGWTPPRAPEPVRLVTMEESGERWDRTTDLTWTRLTGNRWLVENAADDWLVRTVNKRIIEGLLTYPLAAYRPTLLRIFAGEGQ